MKIWFRHTNYHHFVCGNTEEIYLRSSMAEIFCSYSIIIISYRFKGYVKQSSSLESLVIIRVI